MSKELKPIPHFDNEDDEREFWSTHDTTDYVDWSKGVSLPPFKNLKGSENYLEVSIPQSEVAPLAALAAKYHITKSALVQRFILEGLNRERGSL